MHEYIERKRPNTTWNIRIFQKLETRSYGLYDYYIQKAGIIKNSYMHTYNANRQNVV
jgi:hypothetical protein